MFDAEQWVIDHIDTIENRGWNAFYNELGYNRPDVTKYLWEADIHPELEGLTYIPPRYASKLESVTSIELGPLIKGVGGHAFSECQSLEDVKFPEAVGHIEDYAFWNCRKLLSVQLPGVRILGEWSFANCHALVGVTLPETLEEIRGYTFNGCTSLDRIVYTGTKAQWKNVKKGTAWRPADQSIVVHCVDGKVRYG